MVEGTHMCNVEVGEMFLDFMLNPELTPFCGVGITPSDLDLTDLYHPSPDRSGYHRVWVCWDRNVMGLTWSPRYQAVKCMKLVEEIIRGYWKVKNKIFHWYLLRSTMDLEMPLGQNLGHTSACLLLHC